MDNKENGYVFEDVAALTGVADADERYHHYGDDDDDDYEDATATTSTDFIVDNFKIANDAFRRQSQFSSSHGGGIKSGGSVMTDTSNNIISQYSVKNTRNSHSASNHKTSTKRISSSSNGSNGSTNRSKSNSLEEQYTNAMNQISRTGDYYFEPVKNNNRDRASNGSSASSGRRGSSSESAGRPPMQSRDSCGSGNYSSGRPSSGSQKSRSSQSSKGRKSKSFVHPPRPLPAHKLPASNRDPSEEVIAVFGVHGVTGYHFLHLALEAGYKQIRCLVLPGMTEQGFAEDFGGVDNLPPNLRFIVGTLDDTDKVQRVVKNASYVVCLFHDAERTVEQQEGTANNMSSSAVGSTSSSAKPLPSLHNYYDRSQQRESTGSGNSNDTNGSSSSTSNYPHLRFMETLVPLLQDDSKAGSKCRVLLYQASSASVDERGNAPIIGQVVKKLQFSKVKRQQLKEQDRIVKFISETTRDMSMNFIVTRPGDLLWDRPSRKKLAASKSLPGPFPMTHIDLAEFTLGILRNERLYNTCPYVVQDGI